MNAVIAEEKKKTHLTLKRINIKIGLFNVEFLPNQMLQAMKESRLSGTKTYFSNNFR